jgi:nitrate/nitrite transporter NarK
MLLYRTGKISLQSPSDIVNRIALARMLAYVEVVSSMLRRVGGALCDRAVPRVVVVLVYGGRTAASHSCESTGVP